MSSSRRLLMKSIIIRLARQSMAQRFVQLRDIGRAAFGWLAVAQLWVLLASGEKNNIGLITRSVINCEMRAQLLSTIARNISRAFEQFFENAAVHTSIFSMPRNY